MSRPAISVVICFRDWGLDRLEAAIRSHFLNASLRRIEIEVIVSDYGSRDAAAVSAAVERLGASVVRTDTSGPWSRAASLNAGVRAARASCIVTTDADIVFAPVAFPALLDRFDECPDALYLVQCRDLPEAFGVQRISALLDDDWEGGISDAQQHATVRPRWGMGGFAAFSSALFAAINGYDERLNTWGGEDNDFGLRARRAGFPIRWLSRSDVWILHIWHESSRLKAARTEDGDAAMARNRRIVKDDDTLFRNLPSCVALDKHAPLVSIIIPTYRRPGLLWESLASCLLQTFEDFEVLVVENGDSTGAERIVREFEDPRVRYLYNPTPGAAAARNFALDRSVGRYIVIHDDDDVMISTRVQDHLSSLKPGQHGTYSGWIDFDGETFEIAGKYPGKEFSFEAVLATGKVLTHGALMLDRRVFSMFRYEESLSAGIDYGFILLLSRCGLHLGHTGTFGILRRLHSSNMTAVKADEQRSAARRMSAVIRGEIDSELQESLRSRGKAASALSCRNESLALAELAALKSDAGCDRGYEILEAKNFGGGSIEGVMKEVKALDAWLLKQAGLRRPLPIRTSGFSHTAQTFMKLRSIYLRSQNAGPLLVWRHT